MFFAPQLSHTDTALINTNSGIMSNLIYNRGSEYVTINHNHLPFSRLFAILIKYNFKHNWTSNQPKPKERSQKERSHF